MVKLVCAIVGVAGSAFPVDIDASQLVGDLKDAIKAKKPNDLKDVDADKLQLSLAKKGAGWLPSAELRAIRKGDDVPGFERVSLVDTEDEAYSTYSIRDVLETNGMPPPQTRQIHVLVVVPKQGTSVLTVSQDGVFDRCSDPFFSQIPTVDQVGDWLVFTSLLPLTECQKLYIRSSYESIAAQALVKVDPNRRKYAVITGTPGVGKSVFVYYVMWRLIKDKKRVLFFSKKGPIYFDGSTMYQSQSLPNKFNRRFWSPELWCLVDSVDPTAMTELPVEDCSVLLASTPRRDCIGEFKKLVPTPDVFYMPLWTTEELANIAPMYPLAAMTWQNRFKYLGGVPRLVLQDIGTDPQSFASVRMQQLFSR